jgi:3-oxoacyl-[acyl-carrier protein] reductase
MKKNLLIIGGTSGIMIGCYDQFIKQNYTIFASYSSKQSLKNIPKKILKSKKIKFFELNFNWKNTKIIETLKKKKIKADLIINAVGGTFGYRDYSFKIEDWITCLELNFFKHIMINNLFLKDMIKKNFGRILFFSSFVVDDPQASIMYSCSKALLENYVKKSAIIFGKNNILINAIKTSVIAAKNNNWYKATIQKKDFVDKKMKDLIAVERIGTVDDLKYFINDIVSEKNTFMNGSIVNIDGGMK